MSETNSTTPAPSGKPAKPYPEFPLFPHATKRWAKKIRGKLYYFGPWDDPDGSLENYLKQKDDLHAGRKPKTDTCAGDTVKSIVNAFLNHKKALRDAGELSAHTWAKYKPATDLVIATFGKSRLAANLDAEGAWEAERMPCERRVSRRKRHPTSTGEGQSAPREGMPLGLQRCVFKTPTLQAYLRAQSKGSTSLGRGGCG